jgi:hypothetical protein
MVTRGSGTAGASRRLPLWLCGTVVALVLIAAIAWMATQRSGPFTVSGAYQGAEITFDFSEADDPIQILDTLLGEEADGPDAERKRRYVTELLRAHGFVEVTDPRLADELARLAPDHAAADALRRVLATLEGPFDAAVALKDADGSFAEAIYRLDRDHALPRRLRADSIRGAPHFLPNNLPVRVVRSRHLKEGELGVCEGGVTWAGDAQLFRWLEAQGAGGETHVRAILGVVQVQPCAERDRVAVSAADWARLGGGGDNVFEAKLRPVRNGTFWLARAYADTVTTASPETPR